MAPANNSHRDNYMCQALRIAFDRMGYTSPNPPVGAVIVKGDAVVSTGGTGPYGSSHAEVAAISGAGVDLKGADMYVSLEPCNHYGKTPPCTSAIIKAGISRVFIPALDPNPLVSGKGADELRHAGIEVIFMKDMAGSGIDLLRQFRKYITAHKPFVLSKSAITLDGRIASRTGDSKWISSDFSRYLVHKLRAKADAVIVGKNTFIRDNPSLTVRLESFDSRVRDYFTAHEPVMSGRENFFLRSLFTEAVQDAVSPLRVVVGLPDSIDMRSNIFSDNNYLFFERQKTVDLRVRKDPRMAKKIDGLSLVLVDADSPVEEIERICDELFNRGIMFALLEGGGALAGSFLDAGELDQFFYVIAPRIAGGGINCIEAAGADSISDALRLWDVSVMSAGEDVIYNGYSVPAEKEAR